MPGGRGGGGVQGSRKRTMEITRKLSPATLQLIRSNGAPGGWHRASGASGRATDGEWPAGGRPERGSRSECNNAQSRSGELREVFAPVEVLEKFLMQIHGIVPFLDKVMDVTSGTSLDPPPPFRSCHVTKVSEYSKSSTNVQNDSQMDPGSTQTMSKQCYKIHPTYVRK